MTERDMANVREMFAAWNGSTIERMEEFWCEDGDWIWEDPPEIVDAEICRGREAVRGRLAELTSLLGGMTLEVQAMTEIGDEILVDGVFKVEGASSGVLLPAVQNYHLIKLEDGRVRRYRNFTTREDALAAAAGA